MNLLDLFFPRKCPYCLKLINRGELECAECRSEFPKEPYIRTLPSGNKCVSAFMYDSKVREALTRYKFRGKREFYKSFGAILANVVADGEIIADIVTSVPLSKKRLRVRGYNQSELIARELAKILELDYAETLIKCCDNLEQHTLNHDVRAENIIGVYKVIDKINLQGKKILLIDDIVTTGYTLSECCRVLSESENINITCATLATAL
ncbi:MAG: ComF family protein [Candidatus Pseudoruminococcus sp.]|nr:ComF family protein [Ruminococcus sp.]MDY2782047.1 ComF family protein [Candidatus Pseudoruminococcus sp.]